MRTLAHIHGYISVPTWICVLTVAGPVLYIAGQHSEIVQVIDWPMPIPTLCRGSRVFMGGNACGGQYVALHFFNPPIPRPESGPNLGASGSPTRAAYVLAAPLV